MKKLVLLITILSVATISSCLQEYGKWDDNIKLSVREDEFNASGDSTVITTKGT